MLRPAVPPLDPHVCCMQTTKCRLSSNQISAFAIPFLTCIISPFALSKLSIFYTRTGNWHTGKYVWLEIRCRGWAFKTDVCWRLNNFFAYLWFFFKKQMFNILSLRLYYYIYWKFIRLYEQQQEIKVPFLAIFCTYSRNPSDINLQRLNFNFIYCNLYYFNFAYWE